MGGYARGVDERAERPGRFLLLLVSGLLRLRWCGDGRGRLSAVGLSLVLFLLLCTTFGTQYLSWLWRPRI